MFSKNMSKKNDLLILFLSFNISFLTSCKKDDDSQEDTVPKRDLAEQYIAENDSIIEFMQTHFYNYTDFENIGSNQNPELIIDTIAGDNADKTPIFEQVKWIDIEVKDDDDNVVVHLKSPISAALFLPKKQKDNTSLTMLLMPIRLND